MKSVRLGLFAWIVVFGLLLFIATPSFAASGDPCTFVDNGQTVSGTQTDFGCIPYDPGLFVQKFYGIGLGFIGATALLVIIYGAYLLMTSGGNPEQIKSGKNAIMYSVIGILLAVFGFVFIQVVTGDILRIPGFT